MVKLTTILKGCLSRWPLHAAFLILGVSRVFVFVSHEMWRDEPWLYLIVRDSRNFGELLQWLTYERSHPLWPVIMYGMKLIGLTSVEAVNFFYLGISLCLLAVIFYGIPRLPLPLRVLVGISYVLLYEYTAVVRMYGISALLIAVFLMLEMRNHKPIFWQAIVLGLLSLSSNVGLFAAAGFTLYLFLDSSRAPLTTRVIAVAVVTLGMVLSVASALPATDLVEDPGLVRYRFMAGEFSYVPRILQTINRIFFDGFLYIPDFTTLHWWENSSLISRVFGLDSFATKATVLAMGTAILLLAVFILRQIARSHLPAALALSVIWLLNVYAFSTTHPGNIRHFGIGVIATLTIILLVWRRNPSRSTRLVANFAVLVLVVQGLSGVWATYQEGTTVFSQSTKVGKWIISNYPSETPIVYPSYTGAPISAITGQKVYSLELERPISFVPQTNEIENPMSITSVAEHVSDHPLLVTNFPFHASINGGQVISEPVRSFEPANIHNESFWVQRLRLGTTAEKDEENWTLKLLPFSPVSQGDAHWIVRTSSQQPQYHLLIPEKRFDNQLGSTVEVLIKFIDAPLEESDPNIAMLSIQDGKYEAKLAFFDKKVKIFDLNDQKDEFEIDTGEFHTYRLTIEGDLLVAYIDEIKVATVTLSNDISQKLPFERQHKKVLFGDFSQPYGRDMQAEIGYLAYSTHGAFIPKPAADWTDLYKINRMSGETATLWQPSGTFKVLSLAGNMTTLVTERQDVGFFQATVKDLDNSKGSTAEVRTRIIRSPESGFQGVMFSLIDGKREGKISFYLDRIEIRDQNDLKARYIMDTSTDIRSYRLAIQGDTLRAFVDNQEVAAVILSNVVLEKKILFGDLSAAKEENMAVVVDYLAYSIDGAKEHGGSHIRALTPDEHVVQASTAQGSYNWTALRPGFMIKTSGTEQKQISFRDDKLDNALGSTVEVRVKTIETPEKGYNGAILSIMDGTREGKLSFFRNRVELRDQNGLIAVHEMDTTIEFNIYRMTILGNALGLYVNNEMVASVTLSNKVTSKQILFGDFSSEIGENAHLQVSYLAYSVIEARAP